MSLRSPFPDVEIPDVPLFDFLFGDIDPADLDRTALCDGVTGASVSYAQLTEMIERIAAGLAARGFAPGTVIGLHAPNSPAFAAVFHGILRAGCVATTINVLYTAEDIAKQLADSRAQFVITVGAVAERAVAAARAVELPPEHVVVLDVPDPVNPQRNGLDSLLGNPSDAPRLDIDPATQLAVLPYSSGTTGRPKGVMLTHRNLVANVCQIESMLGVGRDDTVLALLPFFHIYGMTVLLNAALRQRATLVTLPRFDLGVFLETVSAHRCTYLFIAPPMAVALAKHPAIDDFDLSAVRTVLSGAAPLDAELGAAVARRLDCRVRQGYGMSEMSPVSHAIPLDRDDISLDSVGLTVPNMVCKLVDPATGEQIPVPDTGVSAPGELWCKGPNIMLGYLGNPVATQETLDLDGYLHTGDIATIDSGGVVTIVDRLKELIKYKGYQVPPAELEAVLLTHPQIADAAVVGVNDAEGQEIPKAFVVAQTGVELAAAEVIEFVAERVAPHKRVRAVEFIDTIPKSATGKILRRELRR